VTRAESSIRIRFSFARIGSGRSDVADVAAAYLPVSVGFHFSPFAFSPMLTSFGAAQTLPPLRNRVSLRLSPTLANVIVIVKRFRGLKVPETRSTSQTYRANAKLSSVRTCAFSQYVNGSERSRIIRGDGSFLFGTSSFVFDSALLLP
jgi:hypothetical protein